MAKPVAPQCSLTADQMAVLVSELSNDPLARGYAHMADIDAEADLNTRYRPGFQVVPASNLRKYLLLNGIWPKLLDAQVNGASSTIKGVATTILNTLTPQSFENIEMTDAAVFGAMSSMCDVMISANVITATDKTNLLGMRETTQTRAAELGLGNLTHVDVAYARGAR